MYSSLFFWGGERVQLVAGSQPAVFFETFSLPPPFIDLNESLPDFKLRERGSRPRLSGLCLPFCQEAYFPPKS